MEGDVFNIFQPVALRLSQHFQRHKSVSHFASQNLPCISQHVSTSMFLKKNARANGLSVHRQGSGPSCSFGLCTPTHGAC